MTSHFHFHILWCLIAQPLLCESSLQLQPPLMLPMLLRTYEWFPKYLCLCHSPMKRWPTFATLAITYRARLQHGLSLIQRLPTGMQPHSKSLTLLCSMCLGTFLCAEQLSIKSTFLFSILICRSKAKIQSWRTSSVLQAFVLWRYSHQTMHIF